MGGWDRVDFGEYFTEVFTEVSFRLQRDFRGAISGAQFPGSCGAGRSGRLAG
jgi:hypothetical protein